MMPDVPEQFMWWVSRATGLVAGLLLVGSLVWGVLLATRALKPVDRPAWLLGLHRYMSTLACLLIVVHLLALVADNYVYFGWREIFVPWGSQWKNTPVALGVIAMYLIGLVQLTSLVMKRIPKSVWRSIHLLSYVGVWLSFFHAAYAGTDVSNPVYQVVVLPLAIVATAAAMVRLIVGSNRKQAQARSARAGAQPVAAAPATPTATDPDASPAPADAPLAPVAEDDEAARLEAARARVEALRAARAGQRPNG
jgi:predicted ferric reductase